MKEAKTRKTNWRKWEQERREKRKCNTNVTSQKKSVIQMWHLDSLWKKKKKITSRFPLKGKKSNFWDMDDESKSTKKLKRIDFFF